MLDEFFYRLLSDTKVRVWLCEQYFPRRFQSFTHQLTGSQLLTLWSGGRPVGHMEGATGAKTVKMLLVNVILFYLLRKENAWFLDSD